MRNAILGLALFGAVAVGTSAYAEAPSRDQSLIHPVYWNGEYCGARCQEHQWRRHERWEARRHSWHQRRWEERHYGYYTQPRY
jgi:hypothetical protein